MMFIATEPTADSFYSDYVISVIIAIILSKCTEKWNKNRAVIKYRVIRKSVKHLKNYATNRLRNRSW